ncbi:MAG: mRNA interferase EndoA [Pelotomaculum sp. PtaU1.Bin035]|nr:MAG: mRNA interferase EndoA [Pelotomaculum sp. PtaU1.Bin035]
MNTELASAEKFIEWLKTKSHLNSISSRAGGRFVKRGQVYWCHFGINIGSEMSKTSPRPAIIVQNYIGNSKSPNTIVVPVTHDSGTLPCLVPLTPIVDNSTGKVILDGQANTANIVCVSKARLGDLIATLSNADMKKVDESMAQTLDLMRYYKELKDKYDKLVEYNKKIKSERNAAQDKIKEIKEFINKDGFTEQSQKTLLELLDK